MIGMNENEARDGGPERSAVDALAADTSARNGEERGNGDANISVISAIKMRTWIIFLTPHIF